MTRELKLLLKLQLGIILLLPLIIFFIIPFLNYHLIEGILNKSRCEQDTKHKYLVRDGDYWICEEINDDYGKPCKVKSDCKGQCADGICTQFTLWDHCYRSIKNPMVPKTKYDQDGNLILYLCPPARLR